MATPMTRSLFPKELVPGLHALFGASYKDYADEWNQVFETQSSNRAFEEETIISGFGYAPVKKEGMPIEFDTAREGWTARYVHDVIGMGFSLTEEALDDNLYDSLSKRHSKMLARSMKLTKNVRGMSVLNNAFDANFAGGDGKALVAADHPLMAGGTFSNKIDADLSELALEQALIQINGFVDDRGLRIMVKEKKLILPKELMFTAERILKSDKRSGTADNDVNALRSGGFFNGGYMVSQYLTDPDAWFIQTDNTDGLKHFQRKKLRTKTQEDFETMSLKFVASERYSFGWSDPRCILGSPGV